MKIFLSFILICVVALIGGLFALALYSQQQTPLGLTAEGTLGSCPDRPNCVSSEEGDMNPFLFTGSEEDTWNAVKSAVLNLGGEVRIESNLYLATTFKSSFFGFVDDVEFRMIPQQNLIHIRSASRVGYSDMGKNLDRVAQLRSQIQ